MYSSHTEQTGNGHNVQQAESQSHAKSDGEDSDIAVTTFTLCDVDLSIFVVGGTVYVQAPLSDVFDAFAAHVSEGLRDLEIRVSEARRPALAPNGVQRAILGKRVAESGVGGGSAQ